ncbi:protein GLUTAMINE DUMPER 2-like [Panicum miliaceum]|uniref:Protein GLUTAMINE DUMPER 2-like n=1 Tax=Panicum miliaceum TaxID=4540 RepID=A0A3L6RS98_PANMI|nr:protein GLUTAMINE DUMPER 2-like [Panicum miliaceum]
MWPAGGEHPMATGHGPAAAASPSSSARLPEPHSPWQSPVPYLFGGLAAMLGLIALALLALACSYWKLSGSLLADVGSEDAQRRGGAGSRRGDGGGGKAAAAGEAGPAGDRWREHVVVIMAGDERPTFLATPASGSGRGVDADDVAVGVGYGGGGSEEGRCVECGARSRPGGDELMSRSEQSDYSGSSVISDR